MMARLALFVLALVGFCACQSAPYMTQRSYADIAIGTPEKTLKEQVGEPYQVKQLGAGAKEYQYIERVEPSPEVYEQHHFFLTIKGGVVVDKRYEHEEAPFPFQFSDP